MAESLRIYFLLLGIAFRSRLQYRSDFFVGIFSVIILNWTNLTLLWVLVEGFQTLQGWHYWEIALLYATWLLAHSFNAVFCWHLTFIEDDVVHGRFDRYLLRPTSPFLQFLGREVNYMGIGDSLVALSLLAVGYRSLGLEWSLGQWLFWIVAVLSGFIIESAIAWLVGLISFWYGRSRNIFHVTLRFNILTQQYPLDIFGQGYRIFVTGFLPVAFVNYYPLTVLLDKPNALNLPILGYLSPVVALILLLLSRFVWHQALRNYSSSGN